MLLRWEAAVTLVKGDLGAIVRDRKLSPAVMRNIRQNLFFSFVFNAASAYPWTPFKLISSFPLAQSQSAKQGNWILQVNPSCLYSISAFPFD
jgi:hypothetical protein